MGCTKKKRFANDLRAKR